MALVEGGRGTVTVTAEAPDPLSSSAIHDDRDARRFGAFTTLKGFFRQLTLKVTQGAIDHDQVARWT